MLDDFITIKRSEYDYLVDRAELLAALDAAGVDNWEGYGIVMRSLAGLEEGQ